MTMIDGGMQPYTLTLDKFLEHAAKWHPHRQVVTGYEEGKSRRITMPNSSAEVGGSRRYSQD